LSRERMIEFLVIKMSWINKEEISSKPELEEKQQSRKKRKGQGLLCTGTT